MQTLHEFALNLLNDPQSLADYKADPQAVLNGAGLGELSPADVQEIMPLVMDTAPLSSTSAAPAATAAGDVSGVLDQAHAAAAPAAHQAGAAAGGVLADLPNLSPVFEAVSHVAEATGLNTLTHGALGGVSHVVDGVAGATSGIPLAGPLVDAGATDLQNTVGAVGDHVFDGKLVGAAVDATTNHLGDALLWKTAVSEVSALPGVGGPVGGLVENVRQHGSDLLGSVNDAIGSTPVGVHGSDLRADVSHATGDLTGAGDLNGTLDHALGSAPALPAVPGVGGGVPALPAVPGVGGGVPALPAVPGVGGGLPALPAVPGVGGVPALPAVPGLDGLPALPAVPGVDGVPALPGVGAVPAVPAVPGVDGLPALPAVPAVGAVPTGGGLPAVPGLDGLPAVPAVPGVDGLPAVPGVDALPAVPAVDGLPAVPGLDSVPAVPGVGGVPALPGVDGVPAVPGVGALPAVPAVPGVGALPAAPAVPGVGALPAVPAVPAVGALPATPSVPSAPSVPDAGSLTHTIEGATAHAPVANEATQHVLGATEDATGTATQHVTSGDLADTTHTAPVLNEVQSHAHDLAAGLESHAAGTPLDNLHIGH
ncbi:IniB N-terminal domain-containing protein [Amycolatopsis jejuensis]|uniref:IniB N-terminal domain-containing protein n=1 Tax=Amycolatopsis jejuensis TaxID=330084 RepID=UPI001FDEB0BF|nr:IniB N-terminal domain-containing protein [Amycolatopsis jejuensis]